MQQHALSQQKNRRPGKNGFNGGKRSDGPRASCALLIMSAQDARGPHEHEKTRPWSGVPQRKPLQRLAEALSIVTALPAAMSYLSRRT